MKNAAHAALCSNRNIHFEETAADFDPGNRLVVSEGAHVRFGEDRTLERPEGKLGVSAMNPNSSKRRVRQLETPELEVVLPEDWRKETEN